MKYFLSFLLCIIQLNSKGQPNLGNDIVASLNKSQFYFVGQGHNNEANIIVEKELLLALNAKFNVRYDILEYSHSAAFLVNQYLLTGNDTFLGFINPIASFNFIKAIKTYNDTVSKTRIIRFYGLDFENRHDGKCIRKAIEIILQEVKLDVSESLYPYLRTIVDCQVNDLEPNLSKLKTYLKENDYKCRQLLHNYFLDVLLIANAQFNFSSKRDAAMIANFKRLYTELTRNGEQPFFFASFGTGHINPKNNESIAMKLMNDDESPVKNSVCILGIQYFNCRFDKGKRLQSTEGNLNFLCKRSVVKKLLTSQEEKKGIITYLPKEKLNVPNCNEAIGILSGLIVARNFGATTYWTWE